MHTTCDIRRSGCSPRGFVPGRMGWFASTVPPSVLSCEESMQLQPPVDIVTPTRNPGLAWICVSCHAGKRLDSDAGNDEYIMHERLARECLQGIELRGRFRVEALVRTSRPQRKFALTPLPLTHCTMIGSIRGTLASVAPASAWMVFMSWRGRNDSARREGVWRVHRRHQCLRQLHPGLPAAAVSHHTNSRHRRSKSVRSRDPDSLDSMLDLPVCTFSGHFTATMRDSEEYW